jgi:hypothetical protein
MLVVSVVKQRKERKRKEKGKNRTGKIRERKESKGKEKRRTGESGCLLSICNICCKNSCSSDRLL